MKFRVRSTVPNDFQAIAELASELGYESGNAIMEIKLAEILNCDDNCVFVAVAHEKVIGWIHGFRAIRIQSDSFVEIGGLVVSKDYWRQGIGKMLVESAIKWAESINYKTIRVRCNTVRTETHKFYEQIEFEQMKEQKVFEKKLL
jgi:GNAT superfamily N-acetyltransferase